MTYMFQQNQVIPQHRRTDSFGCSILQFIIASYKLSSGCIHSMQYCIHSKLGTVNIQCILFEFSFFSSDNYLIETKN